MAMTAVWVLMVSAAVVCGVLSGREQEVAAAVLTGAGSAVELSVSIMGAVCLWSGVMEVMSRSGLARKLSRLLRPVLARLFPSVRDHGKIMDSISANVSANLLGLGNAATPMGLRAAEELARLSPGRASDALCMLVVCNTASVQLIPSTVAAIRVSAGSGQPFEILPAVWLASACALGAGVTACRLLGRLWRDA